MQEVAREGELRMTDLRCKMECSKPILSDRRK